MDKKFTTTKILYKITNNLRFPRQYYDAETGLHYNWHRYYWPEVGRYVSTAKFTFGADDSRLLFKYDWETIIKENSIIPLDILLSGQRLKITQVFNPDVTKNMIILTGKLMPQVRNLYLYVNNNPVKYLDETGEQGIAGAVAGCMIGGALGMAACICSMCNPTAKDLAYCAAGGCGAGALLGGGGGWVHFAELGELPGLLCLMKVLKKLATQHPELF